MKKYVILIIIICVFLLTGCWDRTELDQIGIVSLIGYDKDSNTDKITVTSQVIRPRTLVQTGGLMIPTVENVTTEGYTSLQAFRETIPEFDRKLYFPHTKVIIIGEEIAREGVYPYIDVFLRGRQSRDLAWIFIAKDTTAKKIMSSKHGIDILPASYFQKMIKHNSKFNNSSICIRLIDLVRKMSGEGINQLVGTMGIITEESQAIEQSPISVSSKKAEGVIISGAAVFKKDKLKGYLNEKETRGVNWILGKVREGTIIVPSSEKGRYVSVDIFKTRTRIKPEIKNGKPVFNVIVTHYGTLEEKQTTGIEGPLDFSFYFYVEKIAKECEKIIIEEIETCLYKVQKTQKSDVLGFGDILNKKYPKVWKKLKDDWGEIFPNVEVNIKVESKIERTGQLLWSLTVDE